MTGVQTCALPISLAIDASLAEAHASKGLALYTAGRYEEAEQSFERAIALKPDLFEAYFFYGRNCFNRGQYGKAAELFGKAAAVSTHTPLIDPQMLGKEPRFAATIQGSWRTYLYEKLGAPKGRKLWMDHGTATLDQYYAPYQGVVDAEIRRDRKSTRLNSSHIPLSRMPSSA